MVFAIFALGVVLTIAGAIYVFLWFVSNAQSSGLVPSSLGSWTMGNLVTFILNSIFWELFIVGIPVAIAAFVAWRWWTRLPEAERRFRFSGRKRSTGGGGGSLFFFIVFCIKVYIDGKWNTPIANLTVDYVVGSVVAIIVWGLIIIGIPLAIGLAWWIRREMKSPAQPAC